MAKTQAKQINIKLVKSLIGATVSQKRVVKALGLSKINQVVQHFDSPTIVGMVKKIPHMVQIVD